MADHIKIKNSDNETVKAGCLVLDDGQILLVSIRGEEAWSFPKGHAEEGESLEQVALRETKEETGYDVQITEKLPDLTYSHGQTGELIRVAMFRAKPLEKTGIGEEGIESRWFSIEDAKNALYYPNLRSYLLAVGSV